MLQQGRPNEGSYCIPDMRLVVRRSDYLGVAYLGVAFKENPAHDPSRNTRRY